MNEAVEEIRNKVQDAFNTAGQMFTRKDTHYGQYKICCEFPDLKEDNLMFPNVSKIVAALGYGSKLFKAIGYLQIPYFRVV